MQNFSSSCRDILTSWFYSSTAYNNRLLPKVSIEAEIHNSEYDVPIKQYAI